MASVEIKKAKIVNKDFCKFSYDESTENNGFQEVDVSSGNIIHDDMRIAFRQLAPHLAFICDEVDDSTDLGKAMDSMEKLNESLAIHKTLQKYRVTGMTITGSQDSQGVIITGVKKLKTEKIVVFNTPIVKWTDEYQYSSELRIAIEKVKAEVLEYHDGKKAPEAQMDLFDEPNGNLGLEEE
ncbi:MAG: hypothetical protein WC756_12045 [Taibaiella sp.]